VQKTHTFASAAHTKGFACGLRCLLPLAGSEGVGKAAAAELARHGVNVLLVSRSQAKLDAAAAEISSKHPNVQVGYSAYGCLSLSFIAADITSQAKLDAAAAEISSKHSDVKVSNAHADMVVITLVPHFKQDS
jgi:NAD(P)-dependent dehydrogenase (short-subunit alcohol dehydrogenase family)